MDVISVASRTARTAILGAGTVVGLVLALPVRTGSVACPPPGEGRVNCLVQHAWAPAAVKVAAAIFAAYLLGELLFSKLPAAWRRWRLGERPVRRSADQGREAVLGDSVLAAATWGVVPEGRRRRARRQAVPHPVLPDFAREAVPTPPAPVIRVAAPEPEPEVAEPEPVAEAVEPEPVAEAVEPEPVAEAVEPEPVTPTAFERLLAEAQAAEGERRPLVALTPDGRVARREPGLAGHLRVIGAEEGRRRKLRLGADPALAVSLFSDAAAAESLESAVGDAVRAGAPRD